MDDQDDQQQLLALQAVPALAALLRHAVRNMDQAPDGVRVTLDLHGLHVELLAGEHALTGFGFDA